MKQIGKEDSPGVCLNPMERTLYRLFQAHREGLRADDLVLHWQELCEIYARETRYDDPALREEKLESLCAESKTVFYSNVSRIKRKFTDAMGPVPAKPYIIRRDADGFYRIPGLSRRKNCRITCNFLSSPLNGKCGGHTGAAVLGADLLRG